MEKYPDISHHHPVANWNEVKKECGFLISKATQGTAYTDPTLDGFIKNCEEKKIPYWLYGFLVKGDGRKQAKYLVEKCKGKTGEHFCGYIIDAEKNSSTGTKPTDSQVRDALGYLSSLGTKWGLYTGFADYSYYKNSIIKAKNAKNGFWWEARYGKNDGAYSPKYPCNNGAALHQFTSQGSCNGIVGKIDLNKLMGFKNEMWFKEGLNMAVKIGSARINEKGTVTGGKAGDQTGGEVSIQNWYLHNKGWVVMHPKDKAVAEKIAKCMEMACANDNIGYCQTHRDDLRKTSAKYNYSVDKVKVKVEVDCSALVRVCCLYAGINVGDFNTASEVSALKKTGKFDIVTDKSVCNGSDRLRRGDVLVTKTKGHTVVVLTNGKNAENDSINKNEIEKGGAYMFEVNQVKKGSKGKDVKLAQKILKGLKYYTGSIDGEFGSNTDKATRSYQKSKRLGVDGIIGKNTWKSLIDV